MPLAPAACLRMLIHSDARGEFAWKFDPPTQGGVLYRGRRLREKSEKSPPAFPLSLQGFAPHRFAIGIEAVHKSRVENQKAEKRAPMNHISVIVWALCMLQSVSAFAPEPSSDEITPVAPQVQRLASLDEYAGGLVLGGEGEGGRTMFNPPSG